MNLNLIKICLRTYEFKRSKQPWVSSKECEKVNKALNKTQRIIHRVFPNPPQCRRAHLLWFRRLGPSRSTSNEPSRLKTRPRSRKTGSGPSQRRTRPRRCSVDRRQRTARRVRLATSELTGRSTPDRSRWNTSIRKSMPEITTSSTSATTSCRDPDFRGEECRKYLQIILVYNDHPWSTYYLVWVFKIHQCVSIIC